MSCPKTYEFLHEIKELNFFSVKLIEWYCKLIAVLIIFFVKSLVGLPFGLLFDDFLFSWNQVQIENERLKMNA